MAEIDNLNFKVILDDTQFNEKVKQDIQLAEKLNVSLSTLLNLKNNIGKFNQDDVVNNRKAQQILVDNARAQEKITKEKMKSEALEKKIGAQIEKNTRGYNQQSRILNELKSYALGYLSIQGVSSLISSLVRVTGEFELQKTTLAAMLGDLDKAEQIITNIQGLAVESPFQFKELTTYAKQLSAFSVPAQELYDTTKMLADISAGLGVGMDRIVLAYGQVRSAAFLRGQEVRQFTEAGIPILDELAKQFSELEGRAVSAGEVFDKISKRLVPFEMVAKVFKDMTSEGGKFYNMQEVQAETLRGKISNLKDAYEVMLNEIGKGQSENIKGAVDWARRLMTNYEQTGRTLVELIATYGLYKTALGVLTKMTGTFNLANHKLLATLGSFGTAIANNPYVLLAAGLATLGYVIYKNVTALESYEKIQKSVAETQVKFHKSLTVETAKLDALYAKLTLAKEGTEAYNDAKKSIYSQYASYISELQNEGVAVNNLAEIYENLKVKIEESQKAKFKAVAAQDIEQSYATETASILDEAERAIERLLKKLSVNFNEIEKQAIKAYVSGVLTMSDLEGDEKTKRIATFLKEAARSGNDAWVQFGTSIESARKQFEASTDAYVKGLESIDAVYGKAQETANGMNPFAYNIQEGGDGESTAQKAIEGQIKSIQKLKDAYEKLMPYINEAQMKSTLKSLFPNIEVGIIDSLDFTAELEKLADELEAFDKDAAQRLRDTIGKDIAGTIADSFKTVERYKKVLDSWMGEDFTIFGEGVTLDVSKTLRDLNDEYAKIERKAKEASALLTKAQMGDEQALKVVRETYGEDVWEAYLINGQKTIDELAAREKEAAKKTAYEKIKALGDDYVKEMMDKRNISLSDFDDKTISQVEEMIDRLNEIKSKMQEEYNGMLLGGLTDDEQARANMLLDALKQIQIVIDDTKIEKEKKSIDNLKSSLDALSELGGSLAEFGLEEIGNQLSDVAKGFSNIIEKAASGDVLGTILATVTMVYNSIAGVITEAYEEQRMLNDATREYNDIVNDLRRNSYSTIFGTDDMGLAAENAKILKEAQDLYAKEVAELNRVGFKGVKGPGTSISFVKTSVADILKGISEAQGWEMYLESGELNIDALETHFDAYAKKLTKKQRDLIEDLIESGNALEDAAAQQAQYLTELFGNVADNIAESMVDAFIESGDAAIDMGKIISDVSKKMVADAIKNIYLMPIYKEFEKAFLAIESDTGLSTSESTKQKLALLEEMLGKFAAQSEDINNFLEGVSHYFNGEETAGGSNLGEGIKGITEGQADLLASYLNAIRADVSMSKVHWQNMDASLAAISKSIPNIAEYLAQVAANTYDTAVNTQSIMEDLRSVLVIDRGQRAIRILS